MLEDLRDQLLAISAVEWVGMLTGFLGVWLSIKEKIAAWAAFVLCYLAYIYIGYQSSYYAFAGMNVAFVAISIHGWIKWSKTKSESEESLKICRVPASHWPVLGLVLIVCSFGIGYLLTDTGARFPYIDAFATTCAFIAQWMLTRKQIETWLFWILSDIIYLSLYAIDQIWPTALLFLVFTGLALKGWRDWKQQLQ
jgi:nicotinamide mononucleotide transporter